MPEVEHKYAIYIDANGARQIIFAKDLSNPNTLEVARLNDLYDSSEQIRLSARAPDGIIPHFYEIGTNSGARKVYTGEVDPTHNARVVQLATALSDLDTVSLVLKDLDKSGGAIKELFKLPGYKWAPEVHRILKADAIVRHDVFGQSLELGMSIHRPWIAIEVIHTHYPEEEAFAALLETSKNVPLIVLFDLTAKPNSFIRVNKDTETLQIRPWTFYIREGAVWKGEERTKINTSARLKIDVDSLLDWWAKK